MPYYTVRTNCEYSTTIEADGPGSAIDKANRTDLADWNQAWAPTEAEPDDSGDLADAAELSRRESSACDR